MKKAHFVFRNFSPENRAFYKVEKCGRAREVEDNMARARYMLAMLGPTLAITCPLPCNHTHTHTHTHTHRNM
jgi:hypothetical protein